MTKVGSKVVHLADLHRYICNSEYRPQTSITGKHELNFVSSSGMVCNLYMRQQTLIRLDSKDFRDTIRELAKYSDH